MYDIIFKTHEETNGSLRTLPFKILFTPIINITIPINISGCILERRKTVTKENIIEWYLTKRSFFSNTKKYRDKIGIQANREFLEFSGLYLISSIVYILLAFISFAI